MFLGNSSDINSDHYAFVMITPNLSSRYHERGGCLVSIPGVKQWWISTTHGDGHQTSPPFEFLGYYDASNNRGEYAAE